MEEIQATINFYIFRSSGSGFSVIKTREGFIAVGNIPEFDEGTKLNLKGEWKEHQKYGRQLAVAEYSEAEANTSEFIRKFFESDIIKGIGGTYAEKIVEMFGDQAISIVLDDPYKLTKIDGIGNRKVEMIIDNIENKEELIELANFLIPLGISTYQIIKIYKYYGTTAKKIIADDPYKLVNESWRINFKSADSVAKKLDINHHDSARLKEGIIFTLKNALRNGHSMMPIKQVSGNASVLLSVDIDSIDMAFEDLQNAGRIVVESENVYLSEEFYAERGIEQILQLFMIPPRSLTKVEQKIIKKLGKSFSDEQSDAISASLENKILILTGGPGTGKTTTARGIIDLYTQLEAKIMLAAPTGRAAKRLEELTGMEAKTIHRLLDYNPKEDYFSVNRDNKLKADLLIVDEASMIDTQLMFNLLTAIETNTTIVFIGDMDQLPPVGAGNPLKDILDSDLVPSIKLTEIFRQSLESKITLTAHSINKGELPDLEYDDYSDLIFIEEENENLIKDKIIDLITNKLPEEYSFNSQKDIQVLAPMYKGIAGVDNLNTSIQSALNDKDELFKRGGNSYKLHDKVMQLKNNYFKNIYNGDIGYLINSDRKKNQVNVDYNGRITNYTFDETEEFKLAYCITIHKSQGSEFPCVILPITNSHSVMLQRNLIYTAITRASKLLVIIGSQDALKKAVDNDRADSRFTGLFKNFTI